MPIILSIYFVLNQLLTSDRLSPKIVLRPFSTVIIQLVWFTIRKNVHVHTLQYATYELHNRCVISDIQGGGGW